MKKVFYKPEKGWVGDLIPYYHNNKFQLFYLNDKRIGCDYGVKTSWHLVRTDDFVNYENLGEALPNGSEDEQDRNAYTGCVIEVEGEFHLFYTGHNPSPKFSEDGEPLQAVMHAVSNDLTEWRKIPEDTFYSDGDIYEKHDWRDPFVFWNQEEEEYWMLLAARSKQGTDRRRGCIALCTSTDLKEWKIKEPFWEPGLYVTHECPDLFKMGDWWYLVYSTFSDKFVTHYRMSKSIDGPWLAPENDSFDGRGFYAAKTYSDGHKRYAFGWVPSKEGENDYNDWEWAGSLVVHEIKQQDNGTLSVSMPTSIENSFMKEKDIHFSPTIGDWDIEENNLFIDEKESFTCALAEEVPAQCKISGSFAFSGNPRRFGLMIRTDDNIDNTYYIGFEPKFNRMIFDMWPRKKPGKFQWQIQGDRPFMLELERHVKLVPGKSYEFKILIEESVCVVYVDNKVAMSTRIYNYKKGKWGVFTNQGKVKFKDLKVEVQKQNQT